MVRVRENMVKPVAGSGGGAVMREALLLAVMIGGLAFLSWATGLDVRLAKALYDPSTTGWAWFMREWGGLTATVAGVGAILICLWPGLWRKNPLLYRSALAVVFTALLGVGLLNQAVVKPIADRARPREIVLQDGPLLIAEFSGNSMPSGHAGSAGVLVAPYYVLRRRKPRLAAAILAGGLLWGATVGASRMVLGAHFMSDIIVALGINMLVGLLAAAWLEKGRRIPEAVLAGVATVGLLAVVLLHDFTVNLTMRFDEPFKRLALPCPVTAEPAAVAVPELYVKVDGHGMPVSQLQLVNHDGVVKLRTWLGLYRGLTCTAVLAVPSVE